MQNKSENLCGALQKGGNMKKFLILILSVICFTFTLMGCGLPSNGQSDTDSVSATDTDTDTTTDTGSNTDSGSDSGDEDEKMLFNVLHGNFIEYAAGYLSTQAQSLAIAEEEIDNIGISADVCQNGGATDNGIVFAFSSTATQDVWEGQGISYYFYFVSQAGTAYLGKTSDGNWRVMGEKPISNYNANSTYNLKAGFPICQMPC